MTTSTSYNVTILINRKPSDTWTALKIKQNLGRISAKFSWPQSLKLSRCPVNFGIICNSIFKNICRITYGLYMGDCICLFALYLFVTSHWATESVLCQRVRKSDLGRDPKQDRRASGHAYIIFTWWILWHCTRGYKLNMIKHEYHHNTSVSDRNNKNLFCHLGTWFTSLKQNLLHNCHCWWHDFPAKWVTLLSHLKLFHRVVNNTQLSDTLNKFNFNFCCPVTKSRKADTVDFKNYLYNYIITEYL